MPLYCFNVAGEAKHDGFDLPSIEHARHEAVRLTGETLRDTAERFWVERDWRLNVTDEAGLILFDICNRDRIARHR